MRDHIDFIQAQHIKWQQAELLGYPDVRMKLLSTDDATGALSTILSMPANWKRPPAASLFDEEIYVLDGSLTMGGETFLAHSYAFLPAGYGENDIATTNGATALYFRSGSVGEQQRRDPATIESRLVRYLDVANGSWDGDLERLGLSSMKAGSRMRMLREDPLSGEMTYITATIAFRRGEKAERHPISQEFFLLSGELAGELGTMQGGAYCVRPPMAKHGPYGSPTGALIFFRGFGGKQETYWEETDPFTFYPTHQPILPDSLKALGKPVPPPSRY